MNDNPYQQGKHMILRQNRIKEIMIRNISAKAKAKAKAKSEVKVSSSKIAFSSK